MKELKLLTEWATSITGKYDNPVIVEGGNIFKAPNFSKENMRRKNEKKLAKKTKTKTIFF